MINYFISTFIGTFILEDIALTSAVLLVSDGRLSFSLAFWSCFLGITIGDIGLYLIGRCSSYLPIEKYIPVFLKYRKNLNQFKNSKIMGSSIVISRIIPGTRLPTYLGAGFIKYSIVKFIFLTLISVSMWVYGALILGKSLQSYFSNHWIIILILFLLILKIFKTVISKTSSIWTWRAYLNSWRQWTHFEFWPAWFFYIPLVPQYIYLSVKYRSLFIPFYANPNMLNGGLIGESKWDFLKCLDQKDPTTLKAFKIPKGSDFLAVKSIMKDTNFDFPFILKPDIGQRGFGVRIIHNDFELTEYLRKCDFELILQKLSLMKKEAGLFYIRNPNTPDGFIFSITDKLFPTVCGDGESMLGDLILKDSRAKIIAQIYFDRFSDQLNEIPKHNEIVTLSECGNHCQGAIFKNGQHFLTKKLTAKVNSIAKNVPDFYFGRFDVRYESAQGLMDGQFEIVEINGAGAEATHIWDNDTKLFDAYTTLFQQWAYLFKIGAYFKSRGLTKSVSKYLFFKECFKVFFRKEDLSRSS